MSVVNAGVVRGRLELENEFDETLRDFAKQMDAAKTESKEVSAAVQGVDGSMEEFKRSVHTAADGMKEWAKAQVDAEDSAKETSRAIQGESGANEELGASSRKASQDLKHQADETKAAKHEFQEIKQAIVGFAGFMGAQLSVDAIKGFAMEIIQMGSEIKDMSDRMGVGVEQAQELKYAITQTGGSFNDASTAISKMNDNLTEGKKGTVKAIESLNLSLDDLKRKDPGDAFLSIAEAIAKVHNPMEQSQLALELFGKAGIKWLPAIRSGMSELKDEAHKMGQVLSKEDVDALDRFGDAYDQTMTRLRVGTAQTALVIGDAFKSGWSEMAKSFIANLKGMDLAAATTAFSIATSVEAAKNRINTITVDRGVGALDMIDPDSPMAPRKGKNTDVIAAQEAAMKEAAAEAAAFSKAVKAAIDKVTGKEVQAQIKQLRAVWAGLTKDQHTNKTMVQELLKPYEDIRDKLQVLPPDIEKIRDEFGKRLPSDNIMLSTVTGLNQITTAMKPTQVEGVNLANLLKGLRSDGLLPVNTAFVEFGNVMDASAIKGRTMTTTVKTMSEEFQDFIGKDFGRQIADSFIAGFEDEGLRKALKNATDTTVGALSGFVTKIAQGKMGNLLGGLVGGVFGGVVAFAVQDIYSAFDNTVYKDMQARAKQMQMDILGQFGGSNRRMDEQLTRAGVSQQTQAKIRGNTNNPELLSRDWDTAREALAKYNTELGGLSSILDGAEKIGARVFKELDQAMADQAKPFLAAQDAMLKAMEEAGSTSEEISAQQAKFTKENEDRVYKANDTQIQSFNNLGLIAGGAIANITGRTGDMVGAFREAAPLLDQLIAARDNFGLKDQMTAATAEVLRFYDIVKNNADVFDSVAGVGQVLNGMGDAAIKNVDLVNALGHELEQNALTLESRGVSVTEIYSMLSPQLQDLWETVKDGKLVVDDTTKALLDEAETQGVVGDSMRDVNQQILMVLKEIKGMFEKDLPDAISRTEDASTTGAHAVARAWAQSGRDTTDQARVNAREQTRIADDTVDRMKTLIGELTNTDHHIPMDWKVPEGPPQLPEPDPYEVPVEFQLPEGRMPWDEQYPGSPGGPPVTPPAPPRNPAAGADAAASTSQAPTTTTVIFTDAGRPFLEFTAENLPGYVGMRAGTRVETV